MKANLEVQIRRALEVVADLEPLAAAEALQKALAQIMANLDEEDTVRVLMGLTGASDMDEVSSLVHR